MMAQARKTTERRRRSRKATGDKAGLGQKYYYRLSEIAEKLELKKHILVHWENNFPEIEPIRIGGLGLYTDRDLEIFAEIKRLVREEGFTLKGARHKLCEKISSADPLIYGSTLASPQASEAEASEPEADEPETGQLEASEPEAGQSVAGDLEIGELVASQPETSDPEANTPSSPPVSSSPELMASNSTEPDVLDFKQDLGQFEPEPFNLEPWLSVYTDAQDPIDSFSALSSESSFESSPKTHKPANSSSYLKPLEPGLDTDPWGLIEEVREELLALKAFLRKNTPTP